jgi:hypothetical protein
MTTVTAHTLLNEIEDKRYKPTSKEEDFLDTVRECIDEGEDLSEAQGDWLTSIHKKATGK